MAQLIWVFLDNIRERVSRRVICILKLSGIGPPLIDTIFSIDITKMDKFRRREVMRTKDNSEVAANDAYNEAIRQQRLEEAAMPIGESEAPEPHSSFAAF